MTIEELAQKITEAEQSSLRKVDLACQVNLDNAVMKIKQGKKWTKLDSQTSGMYMVNPQGEIYGIKAYGVPNFGHYYGTLDNPSPRLFVGRW